MTPARIRAPSAGPVNPLGIALQSRNGSLVACSEDEIMAVIRKVCEEMRGDGGNRHRVPFDHLVAKHTGTLDKV